MKNRTFYVVTEKDHIFVCKERDNPVAHYLGVFPSLSSISADIRDASGVSAERYVINPETLPEKIRKAILEQKMAMGVLETETKKTGTIIDILKERKKNPNYCSPLLNIQTAHGEQKVVYERIRDFIKNLGEWVEKQQHKKALKEKSKKK